jgi:hypothetical protein
MPEIVPLLLTPAALVNGQYDAAKTSVDINDSVARTTSGKIPSARTVRIMNGTRVLMGMAMGVEVAMDTASDWVPPDPIPAQHRLYW